MRRTSRLSLNGRILIKEFNVWCPLEYTHTYTKTHNHIGYMENSPFQSATGTLMSCISFVEKKTRKSNAFALRVYAKLSGQKP